MNTSLFCTGLRQKSAVHNGCGDCGHRQTKILPLLNTCIKQRITMNIFIKEGEVSARGEETFEFQTFCVDFTKFIEDKFLRHSADAKLTAAVFDEDHLKTATISKSLEVRILLWGIFPRVLFLCFGG